MTAARLRLSITALNKEIKIIKLFQFWAGSRTVQVSVKLMADCSTLTDQRLESFVDRRQQSGRRHDQVTSTRTVHMATSCRGDRLRPECCEVVETRYDQRV